MEERTSPYLTPEEAASYLRISLGTLYNMRSEGKGPKSYQPAGPKGRILYHVDELDAWARGEASS